MENQNPNIKDTNNQNTIETHNNTTLKNPELLSSKAGVDIWLLR
jgi:hypothetical protein